jgi:hypothetical protein
VSSVTLLIPVHDPNNTYEQLLSNALHSVSKQTRQPDEVLLVANHELGYLDNIQDSFGKIQKLRFLKSEAQSAPENINFGVHESKSDLIRLLFQDDALTTTDSLVHSIAPVEVDKHSWSVIGSVDTDLESGQIISRRIPTFTETLARGLNTIGAPSVVCFWKESYVLMNHELRYMFDCDWYLRMAHRYGPPVEVQEYGVNIGVHQGQATNWAKNLLSVEKRIVKKHHRRRLLEKDCSCITTY